MPPDTEENRVPDRRLVIGSFRVIGKIAAGSSGTTYLGEHVILGEKVCIKHTHYATAAAVEQFKIEARAMWDLRHFSVPVVRDFVLLPDGSAALVISYVPGASLEQIVNVAHQLDPETMAWIVERVLNALAYMHEHGVVHGGIIPRDIIVQPADHSVVLVDFGLAMVRPQPTEPSHGYIRLFSPPEQVAGNLPLIPECDFYSLGMSMIYALTGDVNQVRQRRVPQGTPEPLCRFIEKMIDPDYRRRPHWEDGNVWEQFQQVRQEAFGRTHSGMKPILPPT